MQITVTIANESNEDDVGLLSLDVYPEMTVEALQSSIEAETRIEPRHQYLYHNGQLITRTSATLQDLSVTDGDMIAMHDRRQVSGDESQQAHQQQRQQIQRALQSQQPQVQLLPQPQQQQAGGQLRGQLDAEMVRLQILGDPHLREEALRQNPALADCVDDPQRFAHYFSNLYQTERREHFERRRQIALLNADPFNVEAQARIEEIIRQEQVIENLQNAMEHNPEVFGRVHMLYVDVEVNGCKVKGLVDSGAQATIMSPACAEACGIMRLVDRRFAGVARGVGTAAIIGRVHSAQIKIGSLFLPCSFTVMEGKQVDLLIGLDMLKRHQASIDLAKDRLIIQGVEIPFLSEAEIPKESEDAFAQEPTINGPSGITIGQRSGAVSVPTNTNSVTPPTGDAAGTTATTTTTTTAATATAAATQPATSTTASQSEQQAAAAPAAVQATFPEEAVQRLMALGFTREAALESLQATGGNVEYAASLLFQG